MRRRIIHFTAMIFVPLIFRVIQDGQLIRRQQQPDLPDIFAPVFLEAVKAAFRADVSSVAPFPAARNGNPFTLSCPNGATRFA